MDDMSESDCTDQPQRPRCPHCGPATFQLVYPRPTTVDELTETPAQLAAMLAVVADDSPILCYMRQSRLRFGATATDIEFAFAAGGYLSNHFQQ